MIISILQHVRMWTLSVALAACLPVLAQQMSRQVIVNGAWMNKAQLVVLDALNCSGSQDQPVGAVEKGECERKYRIHEDRMCYCYHVC